MNLERNPNETPHPLPAIRGPRRRVRAVCERLPSQAAAESHRQDVASGLLMPSPTLWERFKAWLKGAKGESEMATQADQIKKLLEHSKKTLERLDHIHDVLHNTSDTSNSVLSMLFRRLGKFEERVMSAISDFKAKQDAHNDKIDAAVTGLQGDIKTLNDKIDALQTSAGQITPEDQALLDDIDARGQAIADKLEALDALTPPTPPVA
jgi:oligoendopeptidase F